MSRIFWDTNIYIYLFEGHKVFGPEAQRQRRKMLERGDLLITSAITLGEIQVPARKANDLELAQLSRKLIVESSTILCFDEKSADAYAEIRKETPVRGADALQLACASANEIDLFVTNDARLHTLKKIPGIGFILPLSKVPL